MRTPAKARAFWPVVVAVLVVDWITKKWAVIALSPSGQPHRVLGDVLRLTLSYNRGAAMGIPLGSHMSGALGVLGIAVAVGLWIWYRRLGEERWGLGATLGLLAGGSLGNAWERILAPRGVVDFIDVGIGSHRFWTFNVADSALTVGVVLLVFMLETGDREAASEVSQPPEAPQPDASGSPEDLGDRPSLPD